MIKLYDVSTEEGRKDLAKALGLRRIEYDGDSGITLVYRNGKTLMMALDDYSVTVTTP